MTKKEAAEGILGAFYTLNGYFVKVKQAYAIEKVKFSFVEKGKHGTGFDIYVEMDDFDNLCDEILSKELLHKIQNDKGQFPSAWTYITGKKGSKELAIGHGSKQEIVIQGRDKSIGKTAFIGIAKYDDLKSMAKWFRRTSKEYYEELTQLVLCSDQYRPKEKKQLLMKFTSAGIPEYFQQDGYHIPVTTSNGNLVTLILKENSLSQIGNWQAFLNDIARYPITFTMQVEQMNHDSYLFLNQFTVVQ